MKIVQLILTLLVLFDIGANSTCDFNKREYYLFTNTLLLKLNATTEDQFTYDNGRETLIVNNTYYGDGIVYRC